jgi:nitroreductase
MKDVRSLILNTFENRFTAKGYDPEKKVSDEDFMLIMEAARLSPSSFGFEPWKFVLLNNKEIKEKIYSHAWGAQKALDGASHFIIILARRAKDMIHDARYIDYIMRDVQQFPDEMIKERKEKLRDFQENDFRLFESERALFDWSCKQTYIPLANMLTVATMLGVDSTPIEGFHREKVEEILVGEKIYDPEHFGLSCMVAFGYTNVNHRPKTRRKMQGVLEIID